MKNLTISKIVACAVLATISMANFGQDNLGQECGCPPVSSRPNVTIASLGVNAEDELTSTDVLLDCSHNYILDRKIYVKSGSTITIQPGTVIKGNSAATPEAASALIIERGGKIMAEGTKECPIVFTSSSDLMDGSHSFTNVGEWGGLVILGTATNNLNTTNTYSAGSVNGVGFIEGFDKLKNKNWYGAGDASFPSFNDNDNSGILKYVSIRFSGAVIQIANEINALSLGSVGSGTTIDHIEIVATADDNIEFFGGTVNVKYISCFYGDDDMFDWDLGWKGKAQFLFSIAGDSVTGLHSTDNGFEADGDDDKKAPVLRSHPIVYNATMIGNGHILPTSDNSGAAAIQAKELTEGEIYNSIFANFRSGLHLSTGRSNATNLGDAYDNWTNSNTAYNNGGTGVAVKNSLIVKNNTFVGFNANAATASKSFYLTLGSLTTGSGTPKVFKAATVPSAADMTQFQTTDNNSVVASVPGIDYNWAWNSSAHTSYASNPYHAAPITNITSTITPPSDGFYSVVNYRGAFDATSKSSWASGWT